MGELVLDSSGLPAQLHAGQRSVDGMRTALLAGPVEFRAWREQPSSTTANASTANKHHHHHHKPQQQLSFVERSPCSFGAPVEDSVSWHAELVSDDGALSLAVSGVWSFDAAAQIRVRMTAARPLGLQTQCSYSPSSCRLLNT